MSALNAQTLSYWQASRTLAGMPAHEGEKLGNASVSMRDIARHAVSRRLRNTSVRTLMLHNMITGYQPSPGGGAAA